MIYAPNGHIPNAVPHPHPPRPGGAPHHDVVLTSGRSAGPLRPIRRRHRRRRSRPPDPDRSGGPQRDHPTDHGRRPLRRQPGDRDRGEAARGTSEERLVDRRDPGGRPVAGERDIPGFDRAARPALRRSGRRAPGDRRDRTPPGRRADAAGSGGPRSRPRPGDGIGGAGVRPHGLRGVGGAREQRCAGARHHRRWRRHRGRHRAGRARERWTGVRPTEPALERRPARSRLRCGGPAVDAAGSHVRVESLRGAVPHRRPPLAGAGRRRRPACGRHGADRPGDLRRRIAGRRRAAR